MVTRMAAMSPSRSSSGCPRSRSAAATSATESPVPASASTPPRSRTAEQRAGEAAVAYALGAGRGAVDDPVCQCAVVGERGNPEDQQDRKQIQRAQRDERGKSRAKAGEQQDRKQRVAPVQLPADRHETDRKGGQEQRGRQRTGDRNLVDQGNQDPVGEHEEGPHGRG